MFSNFQLCLSLMYMKHIVEKSMSGQKKGKGNTIKCCALVVGEEYGRP